MEAVKFKLGKHKDNGLMYHVYQNLSQGPTTLRVTYLDKFYNLPLKKNFHHTFLKHSKVTKLKPGSHMDIGPM